MGERFLLVHMLTFFYFQDLLPAQEQKHNMSHLTLTLDLGKHLLAVALYLLFRHESGISPLKDILAFP